MTASVSEKNSTAELRDNVAEREGFEPPDLLQSSVFKTDAINRSAISPYLGD